MIKKIFIIFTFALIIFFNISKVQAKEETNLDTTQIEEYIEEYGCTIKVIPITKFQEDEQLKDYYSMTYEVITENCNLEGFFIPWTLELPDKFIMTDSETFEDKRYFKDKFKLMIPKESSNDEFAAKIELIVSFKIGDEEKIHEIDRFISLDSRKSSLEIDIVDIENNKPINGVEIDLENCGFYTNEKYTSNTKGKIFVDRIGKGETIIKIINVPKEYNMIETQKLDIQYNKDEKYTIKLEHKKGNLIIDNLPNATFEIYDIKGEFIGEYIADNEGKLEIQKLNTGKYILKQTKVPNGYKKIDDSNFEIKENETLKIGILNTKLPEEQNPNDDTETDKDDKVENPKDEISNDKEENKNEEPIKITENSVENEESKKDETIKDKVEEDKKAGNEEVIEKIEIAEIENENIPESIATITNPKQNQDNKDLKKLPRTGSDYFEIKLIIFDLIIITIYIVITSLKKKRQTIKDSLSNR